MTDETDKSNLNNETSKNNTQGVPELPKAAEDKSSSNPYESASEAGVEDSSTGQAVDDIVKHESDELLAVEDQKHAPKAATSKHSWRANFRKKKVWIPALIVAVLILITAIPSSRYKVLGLFWKQNFRLEVADSQTGKPVSDATISLDGKTATTNNQGQALLHVAVGHHNITITKKYYKNLSENILVFLRVNKTFPILFPLQATGRQVPITVVNKITNAPLADALIQLAGTEARTDKNGQATIVLPASQTSIGASITSSGYNSASVKVTVTTKPVVANSFKLTPSGQVYFLSNASGNIDIVKTNLDGSGRHTVLAGTGNENPNDTSLLASRDWSYLALEAQRSGSKASLYLITTSSGKLTVIDSGNAEFTPIGWDGHYFLYDVSRDNLSSTQAGHEELKSYNADNGQISILDQSQVKTEAGGEAFYTSFSGFNVMDNELAYIVQWTGADSSFLAPNNSLQDALKTVLPTGGNKLTRKTFSNNLTDFISIALYNPNSAYIDQYLSATGDKYYSFNGTSVTAANITQETFNKNYPIFLLSPSGSQTFWDEARDGKNTLFVGDQNGGSAKQIASLSDYKPYGWFGNYILLSKNDSELYVSSATSLANNSQPLKVTDYYSSSQVVGSYGGGYGGLYR